MAYSPEQIALIDKVCDYYYEYYESYCRIDTPSDDLFVKKFGIDRDTSQWAINTFCKIGDELGILKSSKSGYGYYRVVNINKVEFTNFKNEGGFKSYFSESDKNIEMIQNISLGDNYGQIFQTGDKSNFNNLSSIRSTVSSVSNKEKVEPVWKRVLFNPWIITVGGSLIVAYIAHYFHWV